MGDSMTYTEKSEMRMNVALLRNHRFPHLQRRWATPPATHHKKEK